MIDDAAFDRDLETWLRSSDTGRMSSASIEGALTRARSTSQRGSLALAVFGPSQWPAGRKITGRSLVLWFGTAAVAGAAVFALAFALNVFLPRGVGPGPGPVASGPAVPQTGAPTFAPTFAPTVAPPPPTPTSSPTTQPTTQPTEQPHAAPVPPSTIAPVAIEDQGVPGGGTGLTCCDLPGEVLLTSSEFGLPNTIQARGWHETAPGEYDSDWCWAVTSERSIVIPYKMGCALELRVLWPSEVDCGLAPIELTVDDFAAAVLANDELNAQDWGPLEDRPDWLKTFTKPTTGRVLFVPGTTKGINHTQPNASDCLIQSGETVDELRGDLYTVLILLEVDGELVIVRSGPGHDVPSASDARRRGYTGGVPLESIEISLGD